MRDQKGVALVLTLAVTGVLALLAAQIALTARSHVSQAQALMDRAEADLRLRSRETALLYSMLTREVNKTTRDDAETNPYVAAWNFRGDPFEVDDALIRLQDAGGLFPMPLPDGQYQEFAALLVAIGLETRRAENAARALQQTMLAPRRMPLQSIQELAVIGGLSEAEINRLEEVATLYPGATLNPDTAPAAVLAVKYQGVALEGLLAARSAGTIEGNRIYELTGQTPDDLMTNFLVGPGFRVDITVNFRGIRLRRQSLWSVRPRSTVAPLELWSYRDIDPGSVQSRDDSIQGVAR